jgi:hypothetical protein
MHELADWGTPSLARTALAVVVAVLLVATCIKWLRLRSPDGEQWAWLLLVVQGAMFASLTIHSPTDWFPRPAPPPTPPATITVPVDAPLDSSPKSPKAVPLRLDVPERPFDRKHQPVEVFHVRHPRGQLARLP